MVFRTLVIRIEKRAYRIRGGNRDDEFIFFHVELIPVIFTDVELIIDACFQFYILFPRLLRLFFFVQAKILESFHLLSHKEYKNFRMTSGIPRVWIRLFPPSILSMVVINMINVCILSFIRFTER